MAPTQAPETLASGFPRQKSAHVRHRWIVQIGALIACSGTTFEAPPAPDISPDSAASYAFLQSPVKTPRAPERSPRRTRLLERRHHYVRSQNIRQTRAIDRATRVSDGAGAGQARRPRGIRGGPHKESRFATVRRMRLEADPARLEAAKRARGRHLSGNAKTAPCSLKGGHTGLDGAQATG